MVRKICFVLSMLLPVAVSAADALVWDFTKPQKAWKTLYNLKAEPTAAGLKLTVTGKDSHIAGEQLNIPAEDYERIRITYSASGFSGPTHGEIFFAGVNDPARYGDLDYMHLPSLTSDGKVYIVERNINNHAREQGKSWKNKQIISRLRLDLVNEFPGTIILKKVEVLPSNSKQNVWNFANGRDGWYGARNIKVSEQADGLLLDVVGRDSNITNDGVHIDPKKVGRIRITYSASGFGPAVSTSGEIYFAGDKDKNYTDAFRFRLPSLITDGRDHTLIADAAKNIVGDAAAWGRQNRITRLRLDLVNEAPGKILLKKIELLPPSAEELTDLANTNIKQGWLWKIGSAALNLNLPAGKHNFWLYGVNEVNKVLQAVKKDPAFESAIQMEKHGKWYKLGTIDSGTEVQISLALTDLAENLLVTPEDIIPVLVPDGIPLQVANEITTIADDMPSEVIFDPNKPYFQSKMISGDKLWNFSGPMLVRRKFTVGKSKLDKAVIQIMADDLVDEVYINGKKVDRKWPDNWRNPASVNVSEYIHPGENLLAIRFTNTGGMGGLLYDLTCRFTDRTDKVICGDGSERITTYQNQKNWFASDFNDSNWSRTATRPGPPYPPWNVYLPYADYRHIRGSFEASAEVITAKKISDPQQVKITIKADPELKNNEFVYAHLYPVSRSASTEPLVVMSERFGKLKPVRNPDGSVTVTMKGFKFSNYGGDFTGLVEFGVFRRKNTGSNTVSFTIPARPFKGEKLVVKNDRKAGKPTITVNGKPFYPVWLDVFYERTNDGLTGADSPVNVRTFLAGGNALNWWIGPDKYDFSAIDERISMILREYPNAYVSAWIWCQPPHWYKKVYPERISKQSDGKTFPYYVSEVTFSDENYRRDAQKALTAFVEHCEKYFGDKMFCYNLSGGISLEWQGWGCHSQDARRVLNDYSNAALRDFKAFAAERHPDLKVDAVPSYAERTAPGRTIFRDPVKDALAIAYEEYYSESIVDCIEGIARAVRKACNGNKLIGAYYGYYFEYGNMPPCTNGAGHNAMTKLLKSGVIDFFLSPPSYGVRAASDPGADMKAFASLHHAGAFSVIEDDTRTHLTLKTGFHQTPNAYYTKNLLRRNFGMQLSRRTPLCLLPLIEGRDFSSPEIRADLHKVRAAGQKLFESDAASNVQIAAVVDEHSLKYLRSITKWDRDTDYPIYTYNHSGRINQSMRLAQNILGELTALQRIPLSRVGAGVDYIYLDDVPALADKYKLWIFIGNFAASEKLQAALDAIKDKECTLLVAYGAGFAGSDKDVNTQRMSEMLGMKIKEIAPGSLKLAFENLSFGGSSAVKNLQIGGNDPVSPRFAVDDPDAKVLARYVDQAGSAAAFKQLGKMKLFFYGGVRLTPDLLRALASDAGIFIHSDSDDVYFCGFGIHTIYSLRPGKKVLKFPQPVTVVDIFTDQVLAENATVLELDMQCHETRIFHVTESSR